MWPSLLTEKGVYSPTPIQPNRDPQIVEFSA